MPKPPLAGRLIAYVGGLFALPVVRHALAIAIVLVLARALGAAGLLAPIPEVRALLGLPAADAIVEPVSDPIPQPEVVEAPGTPSAVASPVETPTDGADYKADVPPEVPDARTDP